jgi:hypothetical protein
MTVEVHSLDNYIIPLSFTLESTHNCSFSTYKHIEKENR